MKVTKIIGVGRKMNKIFGGKGSNSSGKEKASLSVPVAVRRADIPVDDNIQHEMGWGSHSVEVRRGKSELFFVCLQKVAFVPCILMA